MALLFALLSLYGSTSAALGQSVPELVVFHQSDRDGDGTVGRTLPAVTPGFPSDPILLSREASQSIATPLAFFSDRDGDSEIYVMAADGSEVRQLTHNSVEDRDPVWAPDGQRLVFFSRREATPDLYLIRADGTGLRRLTTDAGAEHSVAWSPDGRRIAFVSNVSGHQELYLLTMAGSGTPVRLTEHEFESVSPQWSPDGREILFSSNRDYQGSTDGSGDLFLLNVETRAVRRLLETVRRTLGADWSTAGMIAFFAVPNRDRQIYTITPDGKGLQNLSAPVGANSDVNPTWSPDGKRMVFQGDRDKDGQPEVNLMNSDGSGVVRLSPAALPTIGPLQWSDDGQFVAFGAFVDGNWEIHVSSVQGGESKRLTRNKAMDLGISWAKPSLARK